MFTSRSPRYTKCDPVLSGVVHLHPVRKPGVVWTSTMSCRFGLLMDPLDMTGLCSSQCEPNWLVTVSGFQGSSGGGFPAYPAVLPAASRPTCVRRQGDTLRTRLGAVNGFPEVSSPGRAVRSRRLPRETRTPP